MEYSERRLSGCNAQGQGHQQRRPAQHVLAAAAVAEARAAGLWMDEGALSFVAAMYYR
jgi:hypothetical protein